ncbi:MAG: CusA/CzcA family heavy metal efflux RND transporter [Bdellovibrio sp.]|nr:MAG: CusA/CzcA family heavy metal efflux RND transporter [Bdellovibrio sp.]
MISSIVAFSLRKRILVLVLAGVVIAGGIISFHNLPIEAYPDVADTWVQVITQWPGHAAEEVETQITVPLENVFNGVPHKTALRSVTLPELSVITMLFDASTDAFTARLYVLEKIPQATLPQGITPTLAPMASPVGQIFWYFLDSKTRSPMELKEIEDWELEKRWKQVPGVADVVSFGGTVRQFQALLNPAAIANYNLSTSNVIQALGANNQNSGGGFLSYGKQVFNIRGIGNAIRTEDLENVIVSQKAGTPVRVKNLGKVVIGPQVRLGNISMSQHLSDGTVESRDDVVEGTVLARVGESDESVLNGIHQKLQELNEHFLPKDIKIKPFLDRSNLIHFTTFTVEENMVSGMVLVFIVLLFFLGNLRTALIVSVTIPLSLIIASILLDLRHIPANLLSLGALDFGMVVDGAVVMVENIFRYKEERKKKGHSEKEDFIELIIAASREVERPIVYAIAIIILAYLPIFTLQRIEGKLFSPMAWTVAFALLGSLLVVLTIVPVLCSYFMKGEMKEWRNPVMAWIRERYRQSLEWSLSRRNLVVGIATLSFALTIYLAFGGPIGSEFLPHLDEGALWVRGTLPPSTSYDGASLVVKKAREIFMKYPEVPITICQLGRPDDGTDATGFFNTECFVDLKPRMEWRNQFKTKEHLIAAMNSELVQIPGVIWNFSQPISDNVEEMMSGVKGAMVVKLFGDDLRTLKKKAEQIKETISQVKGIEDLGVFEELGQPNINIKVDRDKISRYGLNVSDVQDVIGTAVGGRVASQVIEGEKRFDILVRYQPEFRDSVDKIRKIAVVTQDGYRIPLEELAQISIDDGASMIYRESNRRFIAVKFSVRGRDLGGTIAEAQRLVKHKVLLPEGYDLDWTGEFESQRRAEARLAVIVPLTVIAIFFLLYFVFDSAKWALIIMANVALARIGGVMALFLTGTNFSVSSGVGFLAVFGVSIQTGVLLISYINQLRQRGRSIREAIVEGSILRLRPIMMTALVATFGLIPAAMSHAIGSDSQRPMAIVIVGGLVADLVMAFYLLPTLYLWFARPGDVGERSDRSSESAGAAELL